jgi:hypothetical protein
MASSFETKLLMLAVAKAGKERQELLNKFSADPMFASRFYVDAVTLDKYMEINAERFRPVAEKAAQLRAQMRNKGWTEKKYQKYLGELPEPMLFERPEFSSSLPQKIRDKNIRDFFTRFPAFRVDK